MVLHCAATPGFVSVGVDHDTPVFAVTSIEAWWKQVGEKLDLAIHVSHFPPGTSKWNKVEHRLFSFISINWRGRPLRSYETVVSLIGNTTNRGGLLVRARLDRRRYPIGKKVSPKDLRELKIDRFDFHGDWSYAIKPRGQPR